jgi:hypothetical protein
MRVFRQKLCILYLLLRVYTSSLVPVIFVVFLLFVRVTIVREPQYYFSELHEVIFMCYSTGNTVHVKETRSYNAALKGLLAV